MKTLLKLAMGAAVGYALVHLMKRRSTYLDEQVADTNTVSSGDAAEVRRSPQPQDWRGAQNVLDS